MRSLVDNARNLTDDQARGIADSGGVLGIGFWPTVCGGDTATDDRPSRSARRSAWPASSMSALGSDFDGAVPVPFDATGLVLLTDALLDAGLDDDAIRKVMGGNVRRLLADVAALTRPARETVPARSASIDGPNHRTGDLVSQTAPSQAADDVAPAVAELDTIVSLAKRRGFVFPSSEIYGGINAVWDYGPLGVELKNNVKRAWWRSMVQERDDIVGLDAGILMHPQVWVTSGHVGSFSDPLVECATDHKRFRLDELPGAEHLSATDLQDPGIVERLGLRCPDDGGPLSAPRRFNLMFKTFMGPVEEDASVIYLRPGDGPGLVRQLQERPAVVAQEAAVRDRPDRQVASGTRSARATSCSGCASSSRWRCSTSSGRTPRRRPRSRPGCRRRRAWYERYGVTPERLRLREHAPDELAHYAKKAVDVEYRFPFGWKELEGVHNRGDFDLSRHSAASGESLEYFDQATNEHVIPWIVETAAGADRAAFTFLIDAYREEEVRGETRVSLALHPDLAPYKVAVLPLLKKRPEIVDAVPSHQGRPQAPHDGGLRRHRRDRQAVPTPGRDRHAMVRDGRRRLARGRGGHGPRSRFDGPGAGPGRGRHAAHPRPAGGRAGGLGR